MRVAVIPGVCDSAAASVYEARIARTASAADTPTVPLEDSDVHVAA